MEYCGSGIRVDDYDSLKTAKLDVNKISECMGKIFSRMIFEHGLINSDPQTRNILINPTSSGKKGKNSDFEIVLLNHTHYLVSKQTQF